MNVETKKPTDGAKRKRDHDRRKRQAGLKEFRAWVTPNEADFLHEVLRHLRVEFSAEEIATAEAKARTMLEMLNET